LPPARPEAKIEMVQVDNVAAVRRVLCIVLGLNLTIATAKLLVGWVSGSLAVQSDGAHSTVDAINNLVGLVALWYAAAPPDREHPYGHAKIETLSAFVVAGLIVLTAAELARLALSRLLEATPPVVQPSALVPPVMIATLVVNLTVSRYEHGKGVELGSSFLLADAAHTRSDALVTLAVLAGWVFAAFGYPEADAIVSLLIGGFIVAVGYRVFARTVPVLIDTARVPAEDIRAALLSVPGVAGCDRIRSRGEGRNAYIECRIHVQGSVDVLQAHALTEELELRLLRRFGVPREHVTIHVEALRT
jgi:cation diffusion facilitator family transporter